MLREKQKSIQSFSGTGMAHILGKDLGTVCWMQTKRAVGALKSLKGTAICLGLFGNQRDELGIGFEMGKVEKAGVTLPSIFKQTSKDFTEQLDLYWDLDLVHTYEDILKNWFSTNTSTAVLKNLIYTS